MSEDHGDHATQTRAVRIHIEVDADLHPIRGRMLDAHGDAREFYGWLQLMAAIEAARTQET